MGSLISSGKATEMAAKFIADAIAKDKVVIFSKTQCPYCTMAKEVSFITNYEINSINQLIIIDF